MTIPDYKLIKVTKKSRLIEIRAMIDEFKEEFKEKFGIKIYTKYEYVNPDLKANPYNKGLVLNLEDFDIIARNVYKGKLDPELIMRKGSRKRELVLIRQLVFKEALLLGYGPSEISEYFGWSHSNIIAARIAIYKLLDCRNYEATYLNQEIHHEIEQRIIDKGIVASDIEGGSKS